MKKSLDQLKGCVEFDGEHYIYQNPVTGESEFRWSNIRYDDEEKCKMCKHSFEPKPFVPEYIKVLVESIVENNCIDCKHFPDPITKSICWCEGVIDLVDRELDRGGYEDCENIVTAEWERVRKEYLNNRC